MCSGPEWTIHAAVAMASQPEETQDTDTHREAMCVMMRVVLGLSARMPHRPAESDISLRLHAKPRAALVVLHPLPLSLLIDSPT